MEINKHPILIYSLLQTPRKNVNKMKKKQISFLFELGHILYELQR